MAKSCPNDTYFSKIGKCQNFYECHLVFHRLAKIKKQLRNVTENPQNILKIEKKTNS